MNRAMQPAHADLPAGKTGLVVPVVVGDPNATTVPSNKGGRRTYKKKEREVIHVQDQRLPPSGSRKRILDEEVDEELGEKKRGRKLEKEVCSPNVSMKAGLQEQSCWKQ